MSIVKYCSPNIMLALRRAIIAHWATCFHFLNSSSSCIFLIESTHRIWLVIRNMQFFSLLHSSQLALALKAPRKNISENVVC